MVNIDEYYEQIQKTAIFPKEISIKYLCLGLNGEAGELADKLKKVYRDKEGRFSAEVVDSLILELGDVLWYFVMLSYEVNRSHLLKELVRGVMIPAPRALSDESLELSHRAATMGIILIPASYDKKVLDDPYMKFSLDTVCVQICRAILAISTIVGFPVQEVMNKNVRKLKSRFERGKITGSGDDR